MDAENPTQPPSTPPKASKSSITPTGIPEIHYESDKGRYLVQDNDGNWMPIKDKSLKDRLAKLGYSKFKAEGAVLSAADEMILRIQHHKNVVYAGPLAGYDIGLHKQSGYNVLVTHQRKRIMPMGTKWPTLAKFWENLFVDGDLDQRPYFFGWLKLADATLESPYQTDGTRVFMPGPALGIVGPAACGKTLASDLITELLGGRRGLPYRYMMGLTTFNKDIVGNEVQVVDDEVSSVDLRARRAFGYQIKHMLFSRAQSGHGKGKDAFTLYPFCRLVILVNDEIESLMIMPPIDESLEDKLMLLRACKRPMPMPADTETERAAFWEQLTSELPAFLGWLRYTFVIPKELAFPRIGIFPFKHPEIRAQLTTLTEQERLLTIIDDYLFAGNDRECWIGTANHLTSELLTSPYKHDARVLFRYSGACGSLIGRLAKLHPKRFLKLPNSHERTWKIMPPEIRPPAPTAPSLCALPDLVSELRPL